MGIIMNTGTSAENAKETSSNDQDTTTNYDLSTVTKIIVACPVGVGSSAMGANMLRKKVEKESLNISVTNSAIKNIPDDVDIVITHNKMTETAKLKVPSAHHISLTNFLDSKLYTTLVADLKAAQ